MMPSNGARSGQPSYPSPARTTTLPYPSESSSAAAEAASSGMISIVKTESTISASTAAWYPDPVPISSTRSPAPTLSREVINATMSGWEIVCSQSIGRGLSM